jgi:hypothetical protein
MTRLNDHLGQVAWDANGVCTHHDSVPGTMMNSASIKGSCPQVMSLLNAYVRHLTRDIARNQFH